MKVRKLKPDELQHHGVKGQKWGVRRYQNYDGTLIKKSGDGNQYGGSGAGTNDPRAKHRNSGGKYTTGNSKGVKRRNNQGLGTGPVGNVTNSRTDGDYGKWLQQQHSKKKLSFGSKSTKSSGDFGGTTLTSTDYNGKEHTMAKVNFNKNPILKENQIACSIVKSKEGYDILNLEFKDNESCVNFYNTAAGKKLMSDPYAIQALAKQAHEKGYLEYDPEYADTANASTMPFTCFTNLSPEEQMEPNVLDSHREKLMEEEYDSQKNGYSDAANRKNWYKRQREKEDKKKNIKASDVAKTLGKELLKSVLNEDILKSGGIADLGKSIVKAAELDKKIKDYQDDNDYMHYVTSQNKKNK